MALNKTLVKKELYKQKPEADYAYIDGKYKVYSCELVIEGSEEIIEFKIPLSDFPESLGEVVEAQLLIRWLV